MHAFASTASHGTLPTHARIRISLAIRYSSACYDAMRYRPRESRMYAPECRYTLDVFVKGITLRSGAAVSKGAPAIAVRFLDFPAQVHASPGPQPLP